jgi:hypothetical protein
VGRGEALSTGPIRRDIQDRGYELPRIPILGTRVNRACSAVRYHDSLRLAQLRKGGLLLPASSKLTCTGSAENSLSTEVSRNMVVLDP